MTGLSHDEIAARAYALFLERATDGGTDLDDWVQAERELREDLARQLPAITPRQAIRHFVEHDLASK